MTKRVRIQLLIGFGLLATAWLPVVTLSAPSQAGITLNFKDTEIREVAQSIGEITGRNFILDPRVKGRVTVLSAKPISADAVYQTFLSVLQVHNFAAVPAGDVIKIIPATDAKQVPGVDLPENFRGLVDDVVTHVIEIQNVPAAQLVPILRPLIAQYGHLAAYPGSNVLIISDHAANVERLMHIIQRIDQKSDEEIEMIPLQNATATEVVRVLTALTQGAQREGAVPQVLAADERTNSVLIGGEKSQRLRMRALITHLDTPLEQGGNTQVVYLRFASAENLANILKGYVTEAGAESGKPAAPGAAPAGMAISIIPEPDTNALVITAPPKVMRNLRAVIDQLDIRRAQVLVEAIIVEMTADKAAELGVTWAINGSDDNSGPAGLTNFSGSGVGIAQVGAAAASGNVASALGAVPDGLTLGIGRIASGQFSFAALLRALSGDAASNILSTPSVLTLDNEEAEIKVGQEVPFLTGQFTTGTGGTGSVTGNPFQTIQRQEVGLKLKIKPQINEGNNIFLNIEQEVSSLAGSAVNPLTAITNKRTITTRVIAENGETIVLGGLIDDNLRETEQRVPVLGSIPLLGNLFKYRSTKKVKQNLMVFLRPTIIRDGTEAALQTNAKYNYIRDLQLGRETGVSLMPGESKPVLPELPPRPAGTMEPERDARPDTEPVTDQAVPAPAVTPGEPPAGDGSPPTETPAQEAPAAGAASEPSPANDGKH